MFVESDLPLQIVSQSLSVDILHQQDEVVVGLVRLQQLDYLVAIHRLKELFLR